MTGLRPTVVSISLIATALLLFGQPSSRSGGGARGAQDATCGLSSLPSDIQNHLRADYGSWKVQDPRSLSEYSRKTWAGRKPAVCPGIAVGQSQTEKHTYAVLVVPINHPDEGYRFLVFNPKRDETSYEATVVERYDGPGGSNYFIRKGPVNEFFDRESKRKFQVQAADAVEMVDSAEQEYGAEIYFWSNGRYRNEPVDD
jgi:hypothetical protein